MSDLLSLCGLVLSNQQSYRLLWHLKRESQSQKGSSGCSSLIIYLALALPVWTMPNGAHRPKMGTCVSWPLCCHMALGPTKQLYPLQKSQASHLTSLFPISKCLTLVLTPHLLIHPHTWNIFLSPLSVCTPDLTHSCFLALTVAFLVGHNLFLMILILAFTI